MRNALMSLFIGVLVLAATVSHAKTNYVNAAVSGGTGNGTSWANAYSQLWQAVGAAAVNDEVWVAQGTYAPTNTADRTATFKLDKSGLKLYGGFTSGMGSRDERNWTDYPVILTGEIQNDGERPNNSIHIVTIPSSAPTNIRLDGFVLTNGYSTGTDGGALFCDRIGAGNQVLNCLFVDNNGGAAVYCYSSSPTFSNCLFRGNAGGLKNYGSSPAVRNCRFENNIVGAVGGIWNEWSSSPTLSDCFFLTNMAPLGGAMRNYMKCSPTIQDCVFVGNTATNGGAIHSLGQSAWACAPSLSNCVFSLNAATGTVGGGGAVYTGTFCTNTYQDCRFQQNASTCNGGAIYGTGASTIDTFVRCTFAGNQALSTSATGGGGAGCYVSGAMANFTDCYFAANTDTNGYGGGITFYSTAGTFENCVFSGNSAAVGGALYAHTGHMTVSNSAVCGNRGAGAAVYIHSGVMNWSTFENTLFCGNVSTSYGGAFSLLWQGSFASIRNCTFAGNAAAAQGGAIYMLSPQTTQNVSIANSIFWGNSASTGSFMYINHATYNIGVAVSMTHSDIAGGWTNVVKTGNYAANIVITNLGGNTNINPQFAPTIAGAWTSAESQNPALGQTTFTDAIANWRVNGLQGLPIQPDTASALQYLVASNTPTTVTVWGLVTLGGLTPYAVRDAHLSSTTRRWTPGGVWVRDEVHSPCIDAGDPLADWSLEPPFNGSRINMGFEGNTAQASLAYVPDGAVFLFR